MALSQQHFVLFSVLALLSHTCAGCEITWWQSGGFPAQVVWLTWTKPSPVLKKGLGGKSHWVGLLLCRSDQEESVAGLGVGHLSRWAQAGLVGSMLSSRVQCRTLAFNLPESLPAENHSFTAACCVLLVQGGSSWWSGAAALLPQSQGRLFLHQPEPSVNPLWNSKGAEA